MLRTLNDQPTLWEAILPCELSVLPGELGRVDAAFFAHSQRISMPGLVARPFRWRPIGVDVFEVPLPAGL